LRQFSQNRHNITMQRKMPFSYFLHFMVIQSFRLRSSFPKGVFDDLER
jgi:hypothetical protein